MNETITTSPPLRMITELNGMDVMFVLDGERPPGQFDLNMQVDVMRGEEVIHEEAFRKLPIWETGMVTLPLPFPGCRVVAKAHWWDGHVRMPARVLPCRVKNVTAPMLLTPLVPLRLDGRVVLAGKAQGVISLWAGMAPMRALETGEDYELTMKAEWKGPGCFLREPGDFRSQDPSLKAMNLGPSKIEWEGDDGVLKAITERSAFPGVFLAEVEGEKAETLKVGEVG